MIRKSIKRRLAVSFILIIGITLLAIGVFHWLFIEKVYVTTRQGILAESFEKINAETDPENISDDFKNFCFMNGLTYVLADSTLVPVSGNSRDSANMIMQLFGAIMDMDMNRETTEILEQTEQYQVVCRQDRKDQIEFLELWGATDSGYYYAVRYPMSNIEEAAKVSLWFFIVIGAVMLVVSVIIIRHITGKLTQPIRELSDLSGRMADLDFEAKYTSGGEDEIGQLGANFNTMSEKLENSIRELKSANARLEKDIEEKEQIDEMRQEFLSNVSHELKTPIALIQGYAEGLKEMAQDPESRAYYCDVIIDEADKMNRLVRQLLSLNQLEHGQEQLDMDRFDLAELTKGVVAASGILVEQNRAEIIDDIPEPCYVWGDEFKIEQVLTNYLSNALNHLDGEKKIHINAVTENDTVTVTVFNTGKPIPEEELEKIWTKFYKVDKARTREYGGSGLGLSIVKAIMDLHRQKCWAENYENGVAFKFTLSCK